MWCLHLQLLSRNFAVSPSKEWVNSHPNEVVLFSDGKPRKAKNVLVGGGDMDGTYSLCSKEWMKDGEKLKESYPDFSIEAEARNPEFVKLLKAGASLRNAYLAMHHDEIIKTLVEKEAQEAQEKTAESIRLRGQRPLENGMSGRSTALFKTDVAGLTAAQRAEIAKRAANGEVIRF